MSPKKYSRDFFEFEPGESRHLLKVLRKKAGDRVQIFDGEGMVVEAVITDVSDPDCLKARIAAEPPENAKPATTLNLYPAIIKGERFEWLIEKATELCAGRIAPVQTARTVVHLNAERARARTERWKKVAMSAAKQCGRTVLPEILPPMDFGMAARQVKTGELSFMLWEGEEKLELSQQIRALDKIPQVINLFTGPEGGYTLDEVRIARECGLQTVRLGNNILRAETAAIAAVSVCLL